MCHASEIDVTFANSPNYCANDLWHIGYVASSLHWEFSWSVLKLNSKRALDRATLFNLETLYWLTGFPCCDLISTKQTSWSCPQRTLFLSWVQASQSSPWHLKQYFPPACMFATWFWGLFRFRFSWFWFVWTGFGNLKTSKAEIGRSFQIKVKTWLILNWIKLTSPIRKEVDIYSGGYKKWQLWKEAKLKKSISKVTDIKSGRKFRFGIDQFCPTLVTWPNLRQCNTGMFGPK